MTLRSAVAHLHDAWERAADRRADWRREYAYSSVTTARFAGRSPVLNVVTFPLRRIWGGTAMQMLARLDAEAEQRATAVLLPTPDGPWRLEWRQGAHRLVCRLRGNGKPWPAPLDGAEFEELVTEAAGLTGSALVHFETAARLPLPSLPRLTERGLRWMISVHDFALLSETTHFPGDADRARIELSRRVLAAGGIL